jgi:hypothetical protein
MTMKKRQFGFVESVSGTVDTLNGTLIHIAYWQINVLKAVEQEQELFGAME